MDKSEFLRRTKKSALEVIRLVESLPRTRTADIIGRQLLRSATSVGANYRAACRAKSTADRINKPKIVEEECDETLFWFELLEESGIAPAENVRRLAKQADEIPAMTVASIKTLKSRTADRRS